MDNINLCIIIIIIICLLLFIIDNLKQKNKSNIKNNAVKKVVLIIYISLGLIYQLNSYSYLSLFLILLVYMILCDSFINSYYHTKIENICNYLQNISA
jgi:ABC-type xylose transport system permease subunit